jgi:drug/metabolite transporter (DMT)-like permease
MLLASAGKRIGSLTVNRWRLVFSTLFLTLFHFILNGHLLPQANGDAVFWMALSGITGLAIGDTFLFRAFVILGPRLGMVLMTLSPVFATLFAQVFLGERLVLHEHIAIVVVIAGVSWAVVHRPAQSSATPKSREGGVAIGIAAGVLASLGQAGGLVLARHGMDQGVEPLPANMIRMASALVFMWGATTLRGRLPILLRSARDLTAMRRLTGAALLGPTIGVWLSLVAVRHAPVGIASTLMSLSPVLLIPLSHFLLRERIHIQSVIGTGVAVLGVAFLVG